MAMSKIVVPHLIHLFIRPFDFRFNAGVAASTPGGVLKPRECNHFVALQALIQLTGIGVVAGFGAGKQRDQAVLLHTEYQAGLGGFVGVIGPAFSAGFGKSDFLHAAFFVIEAQAFAAGFGHDGQIQRAVHGQILQGGAGAAGLVVVREAAARERIPCRWLAQQRVLLRTSGVSETRSRLLTVPG